MILSQSIFHQVLDVLMNFTLVMIEDEVYDLCPIIPYPMQLKIDRLSKCSRSDSSNFQGKLACR